MNTIKVKLDDAQADQLEAILAAGDDIDQLVKAAGIVPDEFLRYIKEQGLESDPEAMEILAASQKRQGANFIDHFQILRDHVFLIWESEKMLAEALPQFAAMVESIELKTLIANELVQVQEKQIGLLQEVLVELKSSPITSEVRIFAEPKDTAMGNVIALGWELAKSSESNSVRDENLIRIIQTAGQVQIDNYGQVQGHAIALGEAGTARLVQQAINQEREGMSMLGKFTSFI